MKLHFCEAIEIENLKDMECKKIETTRLKESYFRESFCVEVFVVDLPFLWTNGTVRAFINLRWVVVGLPWQLLYRWIIVGARQRNKKLVVYTVLDLFIA